MATYVTNPLMVPDARCDDDSRFTRDGFPLPLDDDAPHRSWVPHWGAPCAKCGKEC